MIYIQIPRIPHIFWFFRFSKNHHLYDNNNNKLRSDIKTLRNKYQLFTKLKVEFNKDKKDPEK